MTERDLHEVFDDKTVLITGGTGSFGTAFARVLLENYEPKAVRILSRDEFKQLSMRGQFDDDRRLRFLLGDVRDVERLKLAFRGVDLVFHAAALKQVPACEYNPFEAVQTNIMGGENVVSAAISAGVPLTIGLSTDKAVNPANLYGATKLCAEKVITHAQTYARDTDCRFSCVRYGNVVGSRGSVVPLFLSQASTGELTLTDERMTRFWMTLPEAVEFVMTSAARAEGGEVFIPKLPSMKMVDVAAALAPDAKIRIIGIRPGEKIHESLLTPDESRMAVDLGDRYAILTAEDARLGEKSRRLPDGFQYTSDGNDRWLTREEFQQRVETTIGSGH